MKIKNILKTTSLALLLMSSFANANSVSIEGEINILQPKLDLEVVETPVAHVNEALFKVKQLENSGCDLVQIEALSGKKDPTSDVNCLVVFDEIPPGMSVENGFAIRGYPSESGIKTVKLKTYFHNSTQSTPILINEESFDIEILEPVEPKFNLVESLWGGNWVSGDTMSHDRNKNQTQVEVTLEERKYDQRVEVGNLGSCVVSTGESSCKFSGGIPALSNADEVGNIISEIKVSSINRYFDNKESEMNNAWDFRPPVIYDISVRADSGSISENANTKEIEGLIPNNEEVLIVLKSPHLNIEDPNYIDSDQDWYYPKKEDLEVTLIPVDKNLSPLNIQPITLKATMTNKNSSNLEYRMDVSQLGDGRYYPIVNATDRVGNAAIEKEFGLTYLDRNPPLIEIKQRKGSIINGDNHYFLSDIIIKATDGLDEVPTWSTVKIGDQELEIMDSLENDGWKRIVEPETGLIKPNQELTFVAEAYDQSFNIGKDSRTFNYMPLDFELSNSVKTVYKNVSFNKMLLKQVSGKRCRIESTESEALLSSQYDVFVCVPDYYNLASDLSPEFFGSDSYVSGYITELGENDIDYNLYSYTIYGDKVLVSEENKKIEAFEAPAPILSLAVPSYTPFVADSYIIGKEGGHLGRVLVESVGSTVVEASSTEPLAITFNKEVNAIADKTGSAKSTISVYAAPGELWSKEILTIDAYYKNEPELISTIEVPIIKGPPVNDIRVESYGNLREVINTEEYSVTVKVGYSESYIQEPYYDPSEIGEWVVFLAEITTEGFIPVTEKIPANTEGVSFDINLDDTYDISLVPVAELVSPIEGFEKTISGRKIRTKVLNGNPVNGDLTVSKIEDVVPFTTSIKYTPATNADRDAIGVLSWYYSDDNQETWKLLEEHTDKAYISIQILEEGHHFIKAEVINKYTQVKSESAVMQIIGFNKPEFIIEGPTTIFQGESGLIKPKLINSEVEKQVIYRISTDGGETFEEKDSVLISGDLNESFEIHIHARYVEAPEDNDQSWVKERHYVKVKEFRQPRISISGPFRVESGEEYTYNVRINPPYYGMASPVVGEIVLPNGDIIDANTESFKYTMQPEEIQNGFVYFNGKVWVEGFKEETEYLKSARFRGWDYSWPNFTSSVRQPFAFAPSKVDITIRPYGLVLKDIEGISYEWIIPEGVTKISTDNHLATLQVDVAGNYEVITKITDDRGHETMVKTVIETLEAAPYNVEFKVYEPEFMREPLDLNMKATVSGGHPLDKITSYTWLLNGEEVSSGRTYASLEDLPAGNHSVEFVIKTNFGIEHKSEYIAEVDPNQLPTCEFSSRSSSSYTYYTAECEDPDGRIDDYKWIVDDEIIGVSQRFFYKPKQDVTNEEIILQVTDDSGGMIELKVK